MIEMLIYIAVLVFMLVVIIEVVVSIARTDRVIKSARAVESSAVNTLERLTRELRAAESVNIASSTLGAHPGKLVLSGEKTTEFYLFGERIYLKENGVEIGALTASTTRVTSLIFRRFASSNIEGIRAEFVIESGTSTHYRSETFYSSATIR